MANVEKFEDFFGHDLDAIRNAATLLAEAQAALDADDITDDEFNELANDILEIIDVDTHANSLDDRVALGQTLNSLITLAKTITRLT